MIDTSGIGAQSRRQFLQTVGLAISATALGGCGGNGGTALEIVTLEGTFPGSIWRDFKAVSPFPVRSIPVGKRGELFARLQSADELEGGSATEGETAAEGGNVNGDAGRGSLTAAFFPQPQILSLSLLGASWLDTAIAQGLVLPISQGEIVASLQEQLPPLWQRAAVRQGQWWGLPWNWGVTAIAYDRHQVSAPIADWEDLWRPELARKIVLPDNPREVLGLTLKSLGGSYNQPLADVAAELGPAALGDRLRSLHDRVLAYTSTDYLPALLLKDAAVVVGWSSDLFQLPKLDRRFEVILPKSGTALWWDLWVLPRQLNTAPLVDQQKAAAAWFDFLLSDDVPRRAAVASRLPTSIAVALDQLPDVLRANPTFQASTLENAELLRPLDEAEALKYLQLWWEMRA